ncbi:MAG TPA: hypothetical protein P5186_24840 [Candidatus Paceibacterota bacterium]|nr:hypothetical protein [Verrucomicrobiota bacterium]HRY51290.1 hypothetical protein [Candidatus Paceibacterota bacterium]
MNTWLKWAGILILASGAIWFGWRHFSIMGHPQNKALARREIALRVLADHLAAQQAGKTAWIVSNPFTQRAGQPPAVYAFEEAGIRGLQKGWEGKIKLGGISFPTLLGGAIENPQQFLIDPQTKTPLSYLTAPGAWDALIPAHTNVDLIVSLVGLPLDVRNLNLWRQPKPQWVLLLPDLRMLGDLDAVRSAFRSGKLAALILDRPGAPQESTAVSADYRQEFDRFFLLVTRQNLEQMTANWPQAFY